MAGDLMEVRGSWDAEKTCFLPIRSSESDYVYHQQILWKVTLLSLQWSRENWESLLEEMKFLWASGLLLLHL